MLTLQQKKDIYGLLLQTFSTETDIPMSKVALYLTDRNIRCNEFGYKKLKQMISDLGFITMKTKEENGAKNVYVTIHDFEWNEKKGKTLIFSNQEKEKILKNLSKQITFGELYPLDTIEKKLKVIKVQPKEYGYQDTVSFLKAFKDNVRLTKTPGKGTKTKTSVTFLMTQAEKAEKKEETLGKRPVSAMPNVCLATTNPYSEKNIPVKNKAVQEKNKNSGLFFPDIRNKELLLPDSLSLSIKEFTDLGLDNNSLKQKILQDYQAAKNKKCIARKDECLIFPLSFLSKDKEQLIASIRKADSKSGYSYFVNFLGADREKPKNALRNEVHFNDYEESIKELATLSRKENWCYRHSKDPFVILKIYLQYTYYRLQSQNKILYDEKSGFAAFHTGLKTENYEDIYGVLLLSKDRSIKEKYLFQGFTVSASQGLGKIIIEHFCPLPQKATYLENYDQLFFDTEKEIHTDERHIILDNIDRFPLSYLSALAIPFADTKKIIDAIKKAGNNELLKEKLYRKLEENISKNELLYNLLHLSLDKTIEKAKRMVEYDYRMALPSFFPTRNVVSMMLPLEFTAGNGAEAVLLVEKTTSGNYQGQTILTPKQAYVNARLLSPLEHTYLNPSKIED